MVLAHGTDQDHLPEMRQKLAAKVPLPIDWSAEGIGPQPG
jgi:hypothetical protein